MPVPDWAHSNMTPVFALTAIQETCMSLAGREVVAVYMVSAHDGGLHVGLKVAGVVLLHFGCLLVQGVLWVWILWGTPQ